MIANEDHARKVAHELAGLEQGQPEQHSVSLITDVALPFVGFERSRRGSRFYSVRISGSLFQVSAETDERPGALPFDLSFNIHDSGPLASVVSHPLREGAVQRLEAELIKRGETYTRIPDQRPQVSFQHALNIVAQQGLFSPQTAKGLAAYHVVHRSQKGEQPAWDILLRQLPPRPAHGRDADKVPEWMRRNFRNVVDSEAGTLLFSTNTLALGEDDAL